jgi:hypothetical protein
MSNATLWSSQKPALKSVVATLALVAALPAIGAEKCTIDQFSFMTGRWSEQQGSTDVDEQWSKPANGSMIGMYREMKGGKTVFYELLVLSQEGDGVVLRLKHFDANLIGREEKDQSVVLDATVSGHEATFTSRDKAKPIQLVYRRSSKTQLDAALIRERDGKTLRDEFHYRIEPE